MPSPRHIAFRPLWTSVLLLALLGLGACNAFRIPAPPARPTPDRPIWNSDEVQGHLTLFNAPEQAGRATGTLGYANAAAYVGARLREFGFQPRQGSDFRVLYPTPVHLPRAVELLSLGADTVRYAPGRHMLLDGRTDSVRVRLSRWARGSATSGSPDVVVVLTPEEATDATLLQLAEDGIRATWIAVPNLSPSVSSTHFDKVGVVQVQQAALARLLGLSEVELAQALARPTGGGVLPRPVVLSTRIQRQANGTGINLVGYLSGKHPGLRGEAVLVCTDLDGLGSIEQAQITDRTHSGLATAALLEMARQVGAVSDYSTFPERTLIVGVWSSARSQHQGLDAFLRKPGWPTAAIQQVLYLGAQPADTLVLRQRFQQAGLPVLFLDVPPAVLDQPLVTARTRAPFAQPRATPLPAAWFDPEAVAEAEATALLPTLSSFYQRLFWALTDHKAIYPPPADQLSPPIPYRAE
ncbi:MAG: hypothetical protein RhofKO_35390 [Rhodothermales bacterium]